VAELACGDSGAEEKRQEDSLLMIEEPPTGSLLDPHQGGMRKSIELMIGRRLKKGGMSWSREGANNLLKLRVKKQLPEDWEGCWERRAA